MRTAEQSFHPILLESVYPFRFHLGHAGRYRDTDGFTFFLLNGHMFDTYQTEQVDEAPKYRFWVDNTEVDFPAYRKLYLKAKKYRAAKLSFYRRIFGYNP